ncbi:hypothetical protein D3C75_1300030 [compost metagenome]
MLRHGILMFISRPETKANRMKQFCKNCLWSMSAKLRFLLLHLLGRYQAFNNRDSLLFAQAGINIQNFL